jgi:hypothetical protein
MLAGAALGAATTLLGQNKEAQARKDANYNNSPQGIRDRAEAAGFNPLAFVGPGTGTGAQYAPTMGASMANLGALFANAGSQLEDIKFREAQLETENKKLEQLAIDRQLKANVPGIYGPAQSPAPVPRGASSAPAMQGPNVYDRPSSMLAVPRVAKRPPAEPVQPVMPKSSIGSEGLTLAPGRVIKATEYENGPGLMGVENVMTGGHVVIPGFDGEPMDVMQAVTVAPFMAPQVTANWIVRGLKGMQRRSKDRAWDEWVARSKAKDPIKAFDPTPPKRGSWMIPRQLPYEYKGKTQ